MVEVSSVRRGAYAPTRCRRYQLVNLADALVAPPGKAFLRALERFDSHAELHFNAPIGRWVLYRRNTRAACPSEDVLTKEFVLTGPRGEYRAPGFWLIDVLRKLDKFRGGSLSPEAAAGLYLQHLKEEDEKEEEREARWREDRARDVVNDLVDYGYGNRRHFT